MFPTLFCVPFYETSVAVFRARRLRSSDRAFEVAPYKIFHGTTLAEEAYAIDGRFGSHSSHPPVVLVANNDVVFEGQWIHSGTTIFSIYCGAPIPMLTFIGHIPDDDTATGYREEVSTWTNRFTPDHDHIIPIIEGVRRHVRTWTQRWNTLSWMRDEEGGSSYASAEPRGGSPVRSIVQQQARLPKHVADLLIRDAEARGSICPITMEPIKVATSTATPCGHVFTATALNTWVSTHSTCPECRASL